MNLTEYKLIFIVVGLIGVLLLSSPAILAFIQIPGEEPFSELYILGPNKMADGYPSDISTGQNYSLYAVVGNQLGSPAYYVLYVKLLNGTDPLPNPLTGDPSPVEPNYEYDFVVQNCTDIQLPLTFSVEASFNANYSFIDTITINDFAIKANKQVLSGSNTTSYPYILLIELWLYNMHSNAFEYTNRFVYLKLDLRSNS
jgi:hypothetical protein